MPEVKIDLDDNGHVRGAHVVENTESHQVIEEFMLAANEAVAEKLTEQDLLFLRRIHAPPSPAQTRDLTQFVREVGIACGDLNSRFEIQRVLDQVVGRPEAARRQLRGAAQHAESDLRARTGEALRADQRPTTATSLRRSAATRT